MKDKESIFQLQLIDTNCNDCIYMLRDVEKRKSFDHLHEGQFNASHRINYGHCNKFNKPVSFIPETCQPQNAKCFNHRKVLFYKPEPFNLPTHYEYKNPNKTRSEKAIELLIKYI